MIGATVNSSPRLMPPGYAILVAAIFCLSLAGRTARADDIAAKGVEKQPNSVMFIFDCSASTVERDFPRGNGTKMRRLDGARDALIDVLNHPGLRKFRGVGLRVYGRRFGQDKNGQVQLSKYANAQRKESLAAGNPFTELHPGADVELAFPSEILGERQRDEMISTLGSLQSWGFSPLYLAISDAVNDPLPKGERRRIVAITDGFNQQGNVGVLNQVTAQASGLNWPLILKSRSILLVSVISWFPVRVQTHRNWPI